MQSSEIYDWLMENPPNVNVSNVNVWEVLASHYFFMTNLKEPSYTLDKLGGILERATEYKITIPDQRHATDIVPSLSMLTNDQFLQDNFNKFYEEISTGTCDTSN